LSVACSNNAGNTANARTEHGPGALTIAGVSASSDSATDVPNTGIAVGNGVVVQIANERIAVYDRSLALGSFDGGASTMALNSFVLSTPDGGVSDNTIGPSNVTDPRIVFDTFTQRFFYSANDNAKATPVIPDAVGTIYYGWSPIEGSNSNIFDLGSGWCHGRYRPFKVPGGPDNSYYPVDYGCPKSPVDESGQMGSLISMAEQQRKTMAISAAAEWNP
jgi:hypothetical protein